MAKRNDPKVTVRLSEELRHAIDAQRGEQTRGQYVSHLLDALVSGRSAEPQPTHRTAPIDRSRGAREEPGVVRDWQDLQRIQCASVSAAVAPAMARTPILILPDGSGGVQAQWPLAYVRRYDLNLIARHHRGWFDRSAWQLPEANLGAFAQDVRERVYRRDGDAAPPVMAADLTGDALAVHLETTVIALDADAWVMRIVIRDLVRDDDRRPSIAAAVLSILPTSGDRLLVPDDTDAVESDVVDKPQIRGAVEAAAALGLEVRVVRPTLARRQDWRDQPVVLWRQDNAPLPTIEADPRNPRHRVVVRQLCDRVDRSEAVPTLDAWVTAERDRLAAVAGLEDRSAAPPAPATPFADLPGWQTPAPNGCQLFDHQREAVRHIITQGGNAIVADEMGLGKTAAAIVGVHALDARRVVVVCPSLAQRVWMQEIAGWAHDGDASVARVRDKQGTGLDRPAEGFVLVSYDQLVVTREVLKLSPRSVAAAGERLSALAEHEGGHTASSVVFEPYDENGWYRLKVEPPRLGAEGPTHVTRLREVLGALPADSADRLRRALDRLEFPLLTLLVNWQPDILVVDEAHRVKEPTAARTRVVRCLARASGACLAMTGTPVRNETADAGALLQLVRPKDYAQVKRLIPEGFQDPDTTAVQPMLDCAMLRRRKEDVLTSLPPKLRTHQPVALSEAANEAMAEALEAARTAGRADAILGALAQARREIGLGKLEAASTYAADVLQAKDRLVVFAHHKEVIDGLRRRLVRRHNVAVLTGDTSPGERERVQREFQAGTVDVLIVSLTAGGEAINLTGADTCLFAELDWVPAQLFQAEDRLHRPGQTGQSVNALYLVGEGATDETRLLNTDAWMAASLDRKLAESNTVLREERPSPLGVAMPAETRADETVVSVLARLFGVDGADAQQAAPDVENAR